MKFIKKIRPGKTLQLLSKYFLSCSFLKLWLVKLQIHVQRKKKQDRKSSEFWVNWHGMTHSLIILHYQAYYSCLVSDFYLCNSGNIDPTAFSDEFWY